MMLRLGWKATIIILTGMICVTSIEIFAISKGINGFALASSIGAVISVPTFLLTRVFYKRAKNAN